MPAREVMKLYRQHKLHSGPGGPVVKSKDQATAIQISMARKEGHDIPEVKGSMRYGGLVPESGPWQLHRGEKILSSQPSVRTQGERQATDIAARTKAAENAGWHQQMQESAKHTPWENLTSGPDPKYAVQGLVGNVAERMRQQGQQAVKGSFEQGGTVPSTGNYQAHKGEELVPPDIGVGTGPKGLPPALAGSQLNAGPSPPAPAIGGSGPGLKAMKIAAAGGGPNPYLERMQGAVAAPLHRVEGFKRGGTIPRTGIYHLHKGERVIPKNMADRYRQMKHG